MSVFISILLALTIILSTAGGLYNRTKLSKGIGWQFIRYSVISTSIPLLGILVLNGQVDSDSATPIIAGALAYAFGKNEQKDNDN